jgi:DNA gyrase inhibitor GyrI
MDAMLEPIRVMYVKATGGTAGASQAFEALESKLLTMRGRKFYGTYNPLTGEYRACVQVAEGEKPESMGLEGWTIPGGKYARQKVPD